MSINELIANCVESGNATNEEMVEGIQQLSEYLCLITPKGNMPNRKALNSNRFTKAKNLLAF